MAGAMRKMGVYLGLVEDDDEFYRQAEDGDRYDDYGPSDGSVRAAPSQREPAPGGSRKAAPPVRDVALVERPGGIDYQDYEEYQDYDQSYRISTLCPSTYNEAAVIGEHFRSGSPVIMNLTEMDDTLAKRMIDFAAGLTFGLHGRLEKVTSKVFLLSPQNIDVTAEDKARIAEGRFFFNQS